MENGICEFDAPEGWHPGGTCFSVFVKLTPFPNQRVRAPENINSDFSQRERRDKLRLLFTAGNWDAWSGDEIPQTFIDFVKTDSLGNVEYMIVYIISAFTWGYDKDSFIRSVLSETSIYFREGGRGYHTEPAVYNISISNGTAKVFVPNVANVSVEELTSTYDEDEEIVCPNGTTYMTKLHECPYVKLNIIEFHVAFEDAHLIVMHGSENDTVLLVLSRWEYERHDGEILICFEDFLKIYQAWTTKYAGAENTSCKPVVVKWLLWCLAFISCFCFLFI